MPVARGNWTHHHTRRLFHLSMLSSWGLIVSVIIAGQLIMWLRADAETLGITASVGEINPGPTSSGGSGSGFTFIPTAPTEFPKVNTEEGEPVVAPDTEEAVFESVVVNGVQESRWVYRSQYPSFSGSGVVPNAIVFFEIHSDMIIRGSVFADAEGGWEWQSPEPVSPGPHELRVAVPDPINPSLMLGSVFKFFIDVPESEAEISLTPDRSIGKFSRRSDGALFDVLVRISNQHRTITRGENIVAALRFINFGTPGHPVDVVVEYVISDSEHQTVLASSETVAVATQLSYLKTFYTSANLKAGLYTLTVKVPSQDLIATSSDIFEIVPQPIAVAAVEPEEPLSFSVNATMSAGLVTFFGLLFLWELRRVSILNKIIRDLERHYPKGVRFAKS